MPHTASSPHHQQVNKISSFLGKGGTTHQLIAQVLHLMVKSRKSLRELPLSSTCEEIIFKDRCTLFDQIQIQNVFQTFLESCFSFASFLESWHVSSSKTLIDLKFSNCPYHHWFSQASRSTWRGGIARTDGKAVLRRRVDSSTLVPFRGTHLHIVVKREHQAWFKKD